MLLKNTQKMTHTGCGDSVCLMGMKFLIDINLKLYDNQYQS